MILWKLWAGVPVVKLWEAVALVLEIEPSDLKGEPQSWMNGRSGGPFFDPRSFPSRDKQASFDKALSFAERAANAAGPIYLRAGLARGMNKRTAQVSLNEVVAFFVACEWPNIPAPLLALVSGAVSTPADNAAEPVAAAVPSIAPVGNATTDPTTRFLSTYARLTPTTSWIGGRLTDADLVTLEEASRFASRHSGTEVTPCDFLRAAARGEILLRAVSPREATMQPTQVDGEPLHSPAGSLPTLPLAACKALSITGRACWRSIDRPEQLAALEGAWG